MAQHRPLKMQKFDSRHVTAGIFGDLDVKLGVEVQTEKDQCMEVVIKKEVNEEPVVYVKLEKDGSMAHPAMVKEAGSFEHKNGERVKTSEIDVDDDVQFIGESTIKEGGDGEDLVTVYGLERNNDRDEEKRRRNALLMGRLAFESSRQAKKQYDDLFREMDPKDAEMWAEEWVEDSTVLHTPTKAVVTGRTHMSPISKRCLKFNKAQAQSLQSKKLAAPAELLEIQHLDVPVLLAPDTPKKSLRARQLAEKAAWAVRNAEKVRARGTTVTRE